MKSICRADSRSRWNTVAPCMNRIFLTGSRAGYQAHALFVYLAVSLFTKGFGWNVNFLFLPWPALCLPLTLLGNPLSFLSLFSDQPWQAQLLFYSDEWGPVFFFSWRIRQTVHVRVWTRMWKISPNIWAITRICFHSMWASQTPRFNV